MKKAIIKIELEYEFVDDIPNRQIINICENIELPRYYKEDSYDDALAYLVQAEQMHRPLAKVFNTDGIVKDDAWKSDNTPSDEWINGFNHWKKTHEKRKA